MKPPAYATRKRLREQTLAVGRETTTATPEPPIDRHGVPPSLLMLAEFSLGDLLDEEGNPANRDALGAALDVARDMIQRQSNAGGRRWGALNDFVFLDREPNITEEELAAMEHGQRGFLVGLAVAWLLLRDGAR